MICDAVVFYYGDNDWEYDLYKVCTDGLGNVSVNHVVRVGEVTSYMPPIAGTYGKLNDQEWRDYFFEEAGISTSERGEVYEYHYVHDNPYEADYDSQTMNNPEYNRDGGHDGPTLE